MKEFIKNLKFVWTYSKAQKKEVYILIILNILNITLSIIFPVLSAKIIVRLTTNNYLQIIFLAIILFLVEMLYHIVEYLIRKNSYKIYRTTQSTIGIELGKNILKLENSCLDEKGSGLFIQRLTNDTSKMSDVFNNILILLTQIIKYLGTLIAIFIINKIFFVFVILYLLIAYKLDTIRVSIRNKNDKISRESNERVSGLISELVRGARDIKMLNSEDDFIQELSSAVDNANHKTMTFRITDSRYIMYLWYTTAFMNLFLICLLVYLMFNNLITTSIALVLYNYYNQINMINIFCKFTESLKEFNLSTERIYAILHSQDFKKETFGPKHLDELKGNFEFKNVTFGYSTKDILKNLSFKINANETVAFVGKSGAGKTTIFNLLCKMYDIEQGMITIDGINIKELDKDSIRGNITIINQNPYIFNMSIKDNLKLVKSDLTEKDMIEACQIACLDDFINELPNKYDTIIGEGGVNLSGGQKQRLAIARAIVQKTEIILFDEATSSLDNATQEKIQEAIDNMKNEYTILIIAHRLSTIINADRILYIDNGQVKAEGTHQELLKNCSDYKKLYESEITKYN